MPTVNIPDKPDFRELQSRIKNLQDLVMRESNWADLKYNILQESIRIERLIEGIEKKYDEQTRRS
jgi:hypothetical protein